MGWSYTVTRREIIGARPYHWGPLTQNFVGACRLAYRRCRTRWQRPLYSATTNKRYGFGEFQSSSGATASIRDNRGPSKSCPWFKLMIGTSRAKSPTSSNARRRSIPPRNIRALVERRDKMAEMAAATFIKLDWRMERCRMIYFAKLPWAYRSSIDGL